MSSPEEIKAEYSSSLADLTFNSKPLINVLTMLADENSPNARVIVEAIEEHLSKVHTEVKLPMLYLIDCIVKNVGGTYTSLFSKNIVTTFIGVFKAVDEKTRAEMFKLRQTWNEVFPQMKLYAIDVQINQLDPAWPVTAKLPSNSIHLNPKFLKPPTNPSQKTKGDAEPAPVIPGAPAVDKETLLMQEQLIQKQKELLELQQKRLELEVLQTQVKLQEQIKHSIPKTGRPQNILLKPEVAKQLVPSLAHQKPNEINTTLTQQQKLQQMPVPTTNGTKINPVSSALINAKPIRDPRLMRQQHQKQQQDRAPPTDGNAENQLNQRTALLENNKIVTNKVGVRKVRNDPRLINKNDNLTQKSDSPSKSNMSSKSRSSSDPAHKSHKSSRTSQSSTTSDTSTNKIGPATTLGSPNVNKNSDIVKSKNKRKDDKQSSSNLRNKREKIGSSDDVTVIGTSSTSSVPQSTFKSVKTSTKNRNYVKRNLGSASPEVVQDEDLRSFGPPEKQSRLLGDPIEETSIANTVPVSQPPVGVVQPLKSQLPLKSSDVDLRQLPAAVIGKKRTSTESPESTTAKKNKSEILDKLFGDEDTDLRQLTINTEQRPKTPPPPIISSSECGPKSPTIIDSPKSNLDAIRAKLANATNRDKVLSKSYNKNKLILEDQDLRQPITITAEVANKIIISPEDESNIKSGKMTNEESSKLLNKIILQMEKNKLKEAKRKDNESFNTSLQPISDEEFNDSDFEDDVNQIDTVHEDSPISNENISPAPPIISEESLIPFNDKDERLNAGVPLQPKTDYVPPLFYPRDGREIRRYPGPPGLNWRGGRGNRRNWDPPQPRAPIRPWNNNAWVQPPPPRDFDNENCAAPEESEPPMLSNGFVNVEEIKSMAIDGISRDIRFYGETAIVFVGWDDPRELTFQNDGIRKIIFNDTDSFVLGFNDDYKEVTVNGKVHLVKIGAPSREIFIDSVPYECFFGSPGIRIQLDGLPTKVQLEGPPPPVNIGKTKRTDIVAGKINMVINAKVIVPVFLDAKPQKFVLDGETSTLKFVDALKTVLINDVPFNVEYGGLPKPLLIHDKKHFIRFSVLPKGVKPGKVKILNMEGDSESRASPVIDENSQDDPTVSDAYDPGMPITGMLDKPPSGESPERHSDSPNFYQKFIQQQQNNLDVLSNAMTPTLGPTQATGGYQVENNQNSQDVPASLQPVAPTTIPTLNINDLFQKLVASGFVTSTTPKKPAADIVPLKESTAPSNNDYTPPVSSSQVAPPPIKFKKNSVMNLKRITFERPETLRVRQNNLYSLLYSGMQCSTCGMRFTAEASMLYSQHLDWHFRQNRRGKKNSRVATSRRWYYSLSDWKNYEELEDLEEREKNYFDEQKQAEGAGEDADEDIEIPSVVADPDSTDESCVVCRDKFDQFFNEEKEEWHLKNAIRIDDKTYHPVCYEDYQQSLLEQTMDESIKAPEEKEKAQDEQEETATIPGLEIIIDDDDEEEEPVKETQITEIVSVESDESKLVPDTVESTAESSKPENMEEEDDDDDVILNEIAPIKIVVDDDDDEDMDTNAQNASNSNVEDDGFVEIAGLVSLPNGKHVKIKAEPIDKELDGPTTPLLPNDSLSSTAEEADIEIIESTRPNQDVIFSMDGNVEPASGANPVGTSGNRIKINISKPLPVIIKEKESTLDNRVPPETYIDPFEPFPPGEEPEPATLKPALKTVKLKKLPPIRKGTELTGLCSLM